MGNCLVTKLKGVVDNDNLEYFGGIKLHLVGVDPVEFTSADALTFKVLEGNVNISGNTISSDANGATVVVYSKYGIKEIQGPNYKLDFYSLYLPVLEKVSEYAYFRDNVVIDKPFVANNLKSLAMVYVADSKLLADKTSLTNLYQVYYGVADLADFSELVNLVELFPGYEENINSIITGDISNLAKLVNIQNDVRLDSSNVSGTIESLVEGLCENTNSATLKYNFWNSPRVTSSTGYITVDSITVIIDSNGATVKNANETTTYATYNKSTGTWTQA